MPSWLTALVAISFLSGCARDRAVAHSSLSSTQHEHVAAATGAVGQKLCPVTGEPLESMGGAIPVTVKGATIKVCCQGCVKAVNKDPDKYLAIVHAEQQ
ncbi:MAG: hypothetical protein H6822_02040 [Planctomycetaceae bacterium]|nr:hypothetical protein [Planctomycetaceae bacterium]